MHISNYFNTVETIEAAECVKKATKLDKVFFTNSGAESTEGALKLARKYYYQKHGKADSEIISLNHSFHGRTTGSVKLTGNAHYQEAFGPLIEGVKYANINDLESVKALVNEKTAAIIVEPVQGEGGVYVCSKEFLTGLRKLCDELNKTVVIVIHDINFASCYSDYIVALKDGKLVTNGGRVLNVCARGANLQEALAKVYETATIITFDGMYYRHDIGLR